MAIFLQCVISGIAQGVLYALIALGYSIIYSTMKMGHFAQGEFYMFGAFAGFQVGVLWGLPVLVAFFGSIIATVVLMLIVERLAYRPMYKTGGMGLLITTMGMQFVIQTIAKSIWGSDNYKMSTIFDPAGRNYQVLGQTISISPESIWLIVICGTLMVILAFFMTRTKTGIAMNAVSMNRKAAQLMGVKLTNIIAITFILAAALAAIAGVLMAPKFSVSFAMGTITGNKAMIAAVMGGFGSLPGAVLGGIILGVIETLGSFYISSAYKDVFSFAVLIIILFWRPQGLLGQRSITKV
ncbi:MAG: branched-chain amino acid ABC transporter permease [Christensenellales bacterium]|jgi:branched-chain amino acid transport system permease protein